MLSVRVFCSIQYPAYSPFSLSPDFVRPLLEILSQYRVSDLVSSVLTTSTLCVVLSRLTSQQAVPLRIALFSSHTTYADIFGRFRLPIRSENRNKTNDPSPTVEGAPCGQKQQRQDNWN